MASTRQLEKGKSWRCTHLSRAPAVQKNHEKVNQASNIRYAIGETLCNGGIGITMRAVSYFFLRAANLPHKYYHWLANYFLRAATNREGVQNSQTQHVCGFRALADVCLSIRADRLIIPLHEDSERFYRTRGCSWNALPTGHRPISKGPHFARVSTEANAA